MLQQLSLATLFMLGLLRILLRPRAAAETPRLRWVPSSPQPALTLLNSDLFGKAARAPTPPTQVPFSLPLLKTHLSVDQGGFSIEPEPVKDFSKKK